MADKPRMQVVGRHDTGFDPGPPPWDPAVAAPHLETAAAALQQGDLDAADAAFSAAHEASPNDPRPLGGRGLVAMQRKDWAAAERLNREATARRDAGFETHYNLGFALQQQGRPKAALACYQAAFRADPTRPEPIHQIVAAGAVPALEEGAEDSPQPLDTLTRLELYDAVGRAVHHEGSDGTFKHTVQWAIDRGAPWGGIAAWLAARGVHDDGSLVTVLSEGDAWLAACRVQGFLVAKGPELKKAAASQDDFGLLTDGGSVNPDDHVLFARLAPEEDRALIPPQVRSAAHIVGLVQHLFPILGPNSALVLVIDPLHHLGPRRAWVLTPVSDLEVVGDWVGTLPDGSPAPDQVLPGDQVIPSDAVPLYVPDTDSAGIQALVDEHLLGEVVRPGEPEGIALVHADRVGGYAAAWEAFLAKVAERVPEGNATLARWREGGEERIGVCRAGYPVGTVHLHSRWPEGAEDPEHPVPIEMQFLARALFQSPRPRVGAKREG